VSAPVAAALCALVLSAAQGPDAPRVVPDFNAEGMKPYVLSTLRAAQEEVRGQPDDAEAWYRLGALFDTHRLYEQAEVCYASAGELAPDAFKHRYLRAVLADVCGQPLERSLELFAAAEALDPRYAPLFLNRGRVLARNGRPAEARTEFEAALRLDPAYGAAHLGLGQTLLSLNDVAGARVHLEAAAQEAPDDQAVNAALATVYTRLGERDLARSAAKATRKELKQIDDRDALRRAVEDMNVNVHTVFDRGKRFMQEGKYDLAIRDLEIFLSGRPETPRAHALLGEAYWKQGQAAKAIEHLSRAIELDPRDVTQRLTFAKLLLLAKEPDLDAAERHLRAALESEPNHPECLAWLGCLLVERRRYDEAVAHFERSTIGHAPGGYELYRWGTALVELGRPEAAVEKLRLSANKSPRAAQTHWSLAEVLAGLGRVDEAIQHYRVAGELAPSLPAAERIRALEQRGG
jgi:tetratricopeptide (TPR) repeat protein